MLRYVVLGEDFWILHGTHIVTGKMQLHDMSGSPLPNPVSHVIPLDLWDWNVGSNAGFNEVLRCINEFYESHPHSEHFYGIGDVNIYWRYHRALISLLLTSITITINLL
jgi:hypothetical protein